MCGPTSCPQVPKGQPRSWPPVLPPQKRVFSRDQTVHSRNFLWLQAGPSLWTLGLHRWPPLGSLYLCVYPSTPSHQGPGTWGMVKFHPWVLPAACCPHGFLTPGWPLGPIPKSGSFCVIPWCFCVDVGVVLAGDALPTDVTATLAQHFPCPASTLLPQGIS